MRLSHSSLEDCRRSPTRWAQANPIGQRPVRRIGYARIAKLAIYRYHKGTDRARARAYFLQGCQRNGLNNTRRIDAATATLDSYIDWAEQNDPVVADVMIRIELNLGSELLLGGEVSRVDVNRRGGYSSDPAGPTAGGLAGATSNALAPKCSGAEVPSRGTGHRGGFSGSRRWAARGGDVFGARPGERRGRSSRAGSAGRRRVEETLMTRAEVDHSRFREVAAGRGSEANRNPGALVHHAAAYTGSARPQRACTQTRVGCK